LNPSDKSEYNIIDRVEYENNSNNKEVIYFNDSLNSIIGSRATGKSNLLKNIAYAIDFLQCEKKGIKNNNFYNFKDFKLF
jgi:predicted AAA+ superfamily ATPase